MGAMGGAGGLRSAVVTGAAQGIGRAVSQRLLRDGYVVAGLDVAAEELHRTAEHLGERFLSVIGDVTDRSSHQQAAEAADGAAPLVAWVNNAAVEVYTRAHDLDDDAAERILRTNVLGYLLGCSVATRTYLDHRRQGAIVNVSSIQAIAGFPDSFAYSASKGAIDALTRQLAIEYASAGIRCNAVRPGAVLTSSSQRFFDEADDPDALREEYRALHPVGRVGDPAEIADVVAFLLSDGARFMTGACVNVDGGATARCYAYDPDPAVAGASAEDPAT